MSATSLALLLAALTAAGAPAADPKTAAPPYEDGPAVVAKIDALGEGASLLLDPPKSVCGRHRIYDCHRYGPFTRSYCNKMVYAPERRTALYTGGGHQNLRTNDVWEYHLGSNTWYMIFEPDGGNMGPLKLTLMFTPRRFAKNPDYPMNERERTNWVKTKAWWEKHVVLRDGHFVTRTGGPLLTGHTWDTLVYEPNARRMIHGTGAHCCSAADWLHHKFTGRPLAEIRKQVGTAPDGKPYRTMWMFDPAARTWSQYASTSQLAAFRGMGATMCYIPDWKKTLFYVAAQNVSPHAYAMVTYDAIHDRWETLRPNGGRALSALVHQDKAAPRSEQQTAYSPKHKKMVAVLGKDTFAYDIVRNEWSRLATDERIDAHDARTVFAYDANADVFILCGPKQKTPLAVFDLKTSQWQPVTPKGPAPPRAQWEHGKGYYDPAHNCFVLHNRAGLWLYRHAKTRP
jgi:hypothetical protein